jgi:hypothetical protein
MRYLHTRTHTHTHTFRSDPTLSAEVEWKSLHEKPDHQLNLRLTHADRCLMEVSKSSTRLLVFLHKSQSPYQKPNFHSDSTLNKSLSGKCQTRSEQETRPLLAEFTNIWTNVSNVCCTAGKLGITGEVEDFDWSFLSVAAKIWNFRDCSGRRLKLKVFWFSAWNYLFRKPKLGC